MAGRAYNHLPPCPHDLNPVHLLAVVFGVGVSVLGAFRKIEDDAERVMQGH